MAQPTVKFIGRTTDFKGKTLWEIVGNLKGFGLGRVIIRNMFQRYEEPCFFKVLKVEAMPNEVSQNRILWLFLESKLKRIHFLFAK